MIIGTVNTEVFKLFPIFIFKVGKTMRWAKYGHLALTGVFPDKVNP